MKKIGTVNNTSKSDTALIEWAEEAYEVSKQARNDLKYMDDFLKFTGRTGDGLPQIIKALKSGNANDQQREYYADVIRRVANEKSQLFEAVDKFVNAVESLPQLDTKFFDSFSDFLTEVDQFENGDKY